jgi:hypothetical protein
MFKKSLLKTLKSLSPEEMAQVRDVLDERENALAVKEEGEKKEIIEEENKDMPNEEVKDEKKVEETEKVEDTKETTEAENKGEEVEKTEEKETEVEKTEETPAEEETAPVVQEITEDSSAIGIAVGDLVTKEELMEKLSALEAKFDAVVKENEDLKDKYENKDFGNNVRKGVMEKDKIANSTFEEYSRQFM